MKILQHVMGEGEEQTHTLEGSREKPTDLQTFKGMAKQHLEFGNNLLSAVGPETGSETVIRGASPSFLYFA